MQSRITGGWLYNRACWRKVAFNDSKRAFLKDRIVEGADDIIVKAFCPLQRFSKHFNLRL